MDKKRADEALRALDRVKTTNWRDRARKAKTADWLRGRRRSVPRPIYGDDLPF